MPRYIQKRDEQGMLSDPILRFHEMHGANITWLVPQYRPKDTNNEGFGVLVHYDLHNRRDKEAKSKSNNKNKTGQLDEMVAFLEDMIKKLLGPDQEQAFSKECPLMEMGLDSADLLELSERKPGRMAELLLKVLAI